MRRLVLSYITSRSRLVLRLDLLAWWLTLGEAAGSWIFGLLVLDSHVRTLACLVVLFSGSLIQVQVELQTLGTVTDGRHVAVDSGRGALSTGGSRGIGLNVHQMRRVDQSVSVRLTAEHGTEDCADRLARSARLVVPPLGALTTA